MENIIVKINQEIEALSKERDELVTYMQELSNRFESAKQRIAAINGSLESLSKLIDNGESEESNDSESQTE